MGSGYIFQPRKKPDGGGGYAFCIAIPKALWGRIPGRGKAKRIVEGLGTDSPKEAERLAAQRLAHWLAKFKRTEEGNRLSLAEIEDFATESYRANLARMANEAAINPDPDELIWLSGDLRIREEALERNDAAPVLHEIEAAERRYGVQVDPASPTYAPLARALLRAQVAAFKGRMRALQGEPSDKPATFLGADGIDPTTLKVITLYRPATTSTHGPWALFERWIAEAKPAASTVNRWRAVFMNLQAKFGEREISEGQAQEWARGLVTDERSAVTVSQVWLIAVRRIYKWAMEQRISDNNPFARVKITAECKTLTRDKSFTPKEAATILAAASAIEPTNTFQGAQRWVVWLCSYSGARGGEITQLRKQDIEKRGNVWMMRLTPEAGTIKNKTFREVPLHEHLIAQGFLDFVNSRGDGPLFYDPGIENGGGKATNPKRPRAVMLRADLASWVRKLGVTDKGVRPLHGWRHLFKQIAERNGITERISDPITGHAPTTVGRSYGRPTVEDMAEALKKFPRYNAEGV